MRKKMKPVVQEEITGCGIASSAAIAGLTYKEAKKIANGMGIYAEDQSLWSDPQHVRNLLAKFGIGTDQEEKAFEDWKSLPDCALISTNWHLEDRKPFWHWAVFVRNGAEQYVLDSKKSLKNNIRKDLGRIKPKWYIKVHS
ncbi:MAG: hypothetical protein OEY48_07365 [Gammaproteobacteria bacterium]|nr:hypothetical protein [Gammaproteobacteria bacterium]MDH5592650.1 hypothetical protein [Gammaproteobacteria bacterium]